ncbi:MAG: SDR family oxidoreductase [Ignavibacteria bacterium]|nr:SDR family oxidoreductase [Ignavibacteria bacterium]
MKKVALITGGAKRLGKSISMHLARNGFDIALSYNKTRPADVINLETEIKKLGSDVLSVKADLSVAGEIKKLFEDIRVKFGKLDVLVNNAAIFRQVDLFEITEEIFDEFIDVNLKSTLFCSVEGAKLMKYSGDKPCSIINISSLGGIQNWTGFVPYSVSKAGVIKLTKLLAKRLAPDVLVNSVAPGTVWIEGDENINVDKEEEKNYPMKRFGNENDINGIIEYLVLKNKWMTGQVLAVDGGKSL